VVLDHPSSAGQGAIAHVIESTEVRLIFEISGGDDFSDAPRPVASEVKGFPWITGSPPDGDR
jgi:hypothetical protein